MDKTQKVPDKEQDLHMALKSCMEIGTARTLY